MRSKNILPLPFIENLYYNKQRSLSLTNEDINKKWNFFLHNRDDYLHEAMKNQKLYKEENLRWNMYLQYVCNETPTVFKRSISSNAALDDKGRVPILYNFYKFRKHSKIPPSKLLLKKLHT